MDRDIDLDAEWSPAEDKRAQRAAEDAAARAFIKRYAEGEARKYPPYNETVWQPRRRSARWVVVGDQS